MFGKLLSEFRLRKRISKTSLAQVLNVTTGYIVNLESGRRKPPRLEKCQALIRALGLTDTEASKLIKYALRERLSDDSLQFLKWLGQHDASGNPDGYNVEELASYCMDKPAGLDQQVVVSAVNDPMAREALLRTHTDIEWRRLIEYLLSVSPSKSTSLLAVFQQIFSLTLEKEGRFETVLNQ